MDVGLSGNAVNGGSLVADPVGERVKKLFQDFLEDWKEEKDVRKYPPLVRDLCKPERNTLVVSMKDVERYNQNLSQLIQEEYYRLYPFLCAALKVHILSLGSSTTHGNAKNNILYP